MAHVEVGLSGGFVLTLSDNNEREDDVLKQIAQASASGRPDGGTVGGFVPLQTTEGTFRVNPEHVVYVRTVG